MYKQNYGDYRFYIYIKNKGFARTAFFINNDDKNIYLTFFTDLHLSFLADIGEVIHFKIFCLKKKLGKDISYDLNLLHNNKDKYPYLINKSFVVRNSIYNNKNKLTYFYDELDLELYTNIMDKKIFISNPYITIDKDFVDDFIYSNFN
jgi:hypothetical protein